MRGITIRYTLKWRPGVKTSAFKREYRLYQGVAGRWLVLGPEGRFSYHGSYRGLLAHLNDREMYDPAIMEAIVIDSRRWPRPTIDSMEDMLEFFAKDTP